MTIAGAPVRADRPRARAPRPASTGWAPAEHGATAAGRRSRRRARCRSGRRDARGAADRGGRALVSGRRRRLRDPARDAPRRAGELHQGLLHRPGDGGAREVPRPRQPRAQPVSCSRASGFPAPGRASWRTARRSAASPPRCGRSRSAGPIALGYVRREHFEPGTAVTVVDGAGEPSRPRSRPFRSSEPRRPDRPQRASRPHANRLARETSPYLLQHAHNPVDWYPWGDEAFARARARGQADAALRRLLGLPLVPRDGARVVRERRDRGAHEPPLRQRSRSIARSGPTSTRSTCRRCSP